MSNTEATATPLQYRRMGGVALTLCIILFLAPNLTLGMILSFAQQYETLQNSGILEVSAASAGKTEIDMPFKNIYEARYAIIGVLYVVSWSLLAIVATISTRPRRSKTK